MAKTQDDSSFLQRLLTPQRLRIYPAAILAGWLISIGILMATTDGLLTIRGWPLGRDFFAFYAGGRMILEGQGGSVLSVEGQFQAQQRLLGPWLGNRVIPAPYPPAYLVLFAPLASLPYHVSYLTFLVMAIGAVVAAVRILTPHVTLLRSERWPPTTIALVFWPLVDAVSGAQTTPFALLCLGGVYSGWASGSQARVGLWLGLLLLKPQLALPFLGLFALSRLRGAIAVATAVAVIEYLVGALVAGWRWPLDWAQFVVYHRSQETAAQPNLISWVELAARVFGPETTVALGIGWGLTLLTIALLVLMWVRVKATPATRPFLFAAAVSGTLLLGVHVQWYDVALALVPLLFLTDKFRWRTAPYLLALWLLAPVFSTVGHLLPLQPLFLLPLATLALSTRQLLIETKTSLPRFVFGRHPSL